MDDMMINKEYFKSVFSNTSSQSMPPIAAVETLTSASEIEEDK
jgi:hypothetical protein